MNTCRICGKEIGKTYSDKKLRCSSCRKSVENAIGYNERTVEYVEDELFAWKSEYKKLEKENKKLKEERDNCLKEVKLCYNDIHSLEGQISDLEKENKRLKMSEKRYKNQYDFDEECLRKIEEENKKLKEYQQRSQSADGEQIERLLGEKYKLEKENEKLKDKFMLKLAEAFLLPPTSNQMAEYKKRNFSKWYDEIKNQMRKEIKEED